LINENFFAVLDTETTSKDKFTTEVIEIACLIVDGKTLKVVDKFYSQPRATKPELIQDEALAVSGTTKEAVLDTNRPHPKDVLKTLQVFLKKYKTKSGVWGRPIMAGHNVIGFDKVILDRLAAEYKLSQDGFFHNIYIADTLHMSFYLFYGQSEPATIGMDYLRKHMGLSTDKSHTALFDTEQSAAYLIRTLKWFKQITPRANFQNSFADFKTEELYA
jgi:DNA polymerase III epsilon subunit-like protein